MANNTVTNNDKSASELIGLIDSRAKKVFSEENKGALKTRIGSVISYDDTNYIAVVSFPEDGENSNHTYYNKTPEVLAAGDTVRVYYTSNLASGWIGARGGEPAFKQIEIDGVGVGRPSPWDKTSEYFNAYGDGTPTNIAGTEGQTGYFATAKGFATEAKGQYSSAEGFVNTVSDSATAGHVEGYLNQLYGKYSHVEGYGNIETNPEIEDTPNSECNHMEGMNNVITNSKECHIEGYDNAINSSQYSHVEGHACTIDNSSNTHISGEYNNVNNMHYSLITGQSCSASLTGRNKAYGCFLGGQYSRIISGSCTECIIYGNSNTINGAADCSTVLGRSNTLSGRSNTYNLIGGYTNTVKSVNGAFVFGEFCGVYDNINEGHVIEFPIALGNSCFANRSHAHAEGHACKAEKNYSFAFGETCESKGESDILMGSYLTSTSTGSNRTIIGKYNNSDNIDDMLFIIGNGGWNETEEKYVHSNAFTVDKEGNVTCKSINGITPGGSPDTFIPYTTEQAISSAESVFSSVMEV